MVNIATTALVLCLDWKMMSCFNIHTFIYMYVARWAKTVTSCKYWIPVLSIQVVFQLYWDYCTRELALYRTVLWTPALLLQRRYKLGLTGRSVKYGNTLLWKGQFHKLAVCIWLSFCLHAHCRPPLSQLLFPNCLCRLSSCFFTRTCQFLCNTRVYKNIKFTALPLKTLSFLKKLRSASTMHFTLQLGNQATNCFHFLLRHIHTSMYRLLVVAWFS